VVYDNDALYVGARMYDSEPDRIAAPTVRHGQGLGSDDRLIVILDPFNTRRTGYRFETNLNGVRHDSLYEDPGTFRSDWTVIWETAASKFEKGWEAELRIPFKTLPFDPTIDTWGFNFGRGIRRRGEEMAWVSRNRTINASILGRATGFRGMNQGVGLDVVPSFSFSREETFSPPTEDTNTDPSLDMYYRVTPSLNASLTVNTDFSATEVDDRQVNLTRFSLFFPEKRDFFLNDGDLFQFGRIGSTGNSASSTSSENNGRPFFSRRLGLSPVGTPLDLQVGGKLSGRVGRWNIGALAVRQEGFRGDESRPAFVSRVSANVLAESSVGLVVTAGDPNTGRRNGVVGADFRYLNTHIPGGRVLEADAWVQRSETAGLSGDSSAFGLGLGMPNNSSWRGSVRLKTLQSNFNPALGFISRSGVRDTTADIGYTHFTRNRILQSVFSGVDAQRIDLLDGGLQSQIVLARVAELRTTKNDLINTHYSASTEVLAEPFVIYDDGFRRIVVPPGRYSFGETILSLQTGGQRPYSGSATYRVGGFLSGTHDNIVGSLTWRKFRNFALTASYDHNAIELPEGDFTTRLMRLQTDVIFSSTLYWVSLIQYDDVSEIVGVNTRLQWIPKAGQEGLLVLNHRLEDRDKNDTFRSERLDLNVKASYTFRF
jgi:hypothetical protein